MLDNKLPKTVYILLWFPKPSETFVFSEVRNLLELGLLVSVYTLYGRLTKNLSADMQSYPGKVSRLGICWVSVLPIFVCYWFLRAPVKTAKLIARILFREWKGVEKTAENAWACLCAFYLAYRFEKDQVEHIHAPWACGCATAAWLASRLTNIPFSFTMRAWDIYPPDSLIYEKTKDALFIRSETQYNINYLRELTGCSEDKLYLTYNGVPMTCEDAIPVRLEPPYQLLAVGRLVGKKGYEFLLQACKTLKDEGVKFHLHIVGDGLYLKQLEQLSKSLQIKSNVTFHGFQPYEKMASFFREADIFLMPCIIHSSGDRDGTPTVLLEALVHHVPVITTPVSGIPELIVNGVTGVLVPEKDQVAIAEAVVQLISEKQNARDIADRGNKKVLEMFNAEKNHKKVLTLYKNCLLD